jgi:hypothetical protein
MFSTFVVVADLFEVSIDGVSLVFTHFVGVETLIL